jgi:hypothetical protein
MDYTIVSNKPVMIHGAKRNDDHDRCTAANGMGMATSAMQSHHSSPDGLASAEGRRASFQQTIQRALFGGFCWDIWEGL